jgi:prepilin-type processing-associated H-X9-DG protein
MHRRTAIKVLAVFGGAAAAAACTETHAPETPPATRATTKATAKPTAKPQLTQKAAPTKPLAVRTEQLSLARGSDRPLPTTIWRPKTKTRTGADDYPLILFSHGLNSTPQAYTELLTTWARAGFIVAAPAYPHTSAGVSSYNPVDVFNQPADAGYVLTQVLKHLGPAVDAHQIAAAGHSAGGVTTLGLFSGNRDDRLKAGVVLAGRQIITTPLSGPAVPLLFVHGKRDRTVAYADGHAAYDAVTWPKAFLTVTDGGHVATGAELDVVATTSTDFWRWSLYGDQGAKSRLPDDATRGRLASLADHL